MLTVCLSCDIFDQYEKYVILIKRVRYILIFMYIRDFNYCCKYLYTKYIHIETFLKK